MADTYYISVTELRSMGIGRDNAYKLLHDVRDGLKKQGYFLPDGLKAPRQAVFMKLGLEERKA